MNTAELIRGLRRKAHDEMKAALNAGQIDAVIKFAKIIKDADEALQNCRLVAERISAQLNPSHEILPVAEKPRPVLSSATGPGISRKARGKAARDEYVRNLLSQGIHLTRLKGRTYRTPSGKHVGIAYASEIQADKWWMGLPDDNYDVVVFLCETSSGDTLDFVLPPEYVSQVWDRLTLSDKQKEWHIQRSGPNYELEPKKELGRINIYLSNPGPLR